MKAEHGTVAVGDDLLVVGVDEECEHRAVDAERGLDHVGRVAGAVLLDPLELRPRGVRVCGEIEVAAVRDALELRPADREQVLDVARPARVVGELVGVVRADPEMALAEPVAPVPVVARLHPVAVPLVGLGRRDEELHLHLLELERAEDEVARGDLVAERLADLGDTERRLAARDLGHVLEVDEDALRRLGAQVDRHARLLERADARLEHEVEVACLGEVAVGRLAGLLARALAALRLLEMVGAEALLAELAVDERVGESADVAGCLPDLRVEDDRRVERDDVVALLHHRRQPALLDVVLEEHAVVAVVVGRAESAVDLGRGEHEPAPLAQRDDLVHRDGVGHLMRLVARHGRRSR